MSQLISEDAVAFGATDATVKNGFETYKSKDFDKLRKYFYAVMVHGDNKQVFVNGGYDAFEFAPLLMNAYKKFGKNRAILLVSCLAGWSVVRPLARHTKLPIVAALSKVSFGRAKQYGISTDYITVLDGQGIKAFNELKNKVDPPDMRFRPEWAFFHPNGNTETIPGGSFLNQDAAINIAKKYVHV